MMRASPGRLHWQRAIWHYLPFCANDTKGYLKNGPKGSVCNRWKRKCVSLSLGGNWIYQKIETWKIWCVWHGLSTIENWCSWLESNFNASSLFSICLIAIHDWKWNLMATWGCQKRSLENLHSKLNQLCVAFFTKLGLAWPTWPSSAY